MAYLEHFSVCINGTSCGWTVLSWTEDWIRQFWRHLSWSEMFVRPVTTFLAGTNTNTGEEVAIKLEATKTRHPQLAYEYKVYRLLVGGGSFVCV